MKFTPPHKKRLILFLITSIIVQAITYRLTLRSIPCLSQAVANPTEYHDCNNTKTINQYLIIGASFQLILIISVYATQKIRLLQSLILYCCIAATTLVVGFYIHLKPLIGLTEVAPKLLPKPQQSIP